ncbi:MAG TPA: cupin domain-containing protein [Stellaceae bacterium]|nr:cupin domain-containing protein [Stellaceae bacterium]
MMEGVRRVVTTHDARGKAVVLMDGMAPNVRRRAATGITSTLLWVLDHVPARYSGSADFAEVEIGIPPPQHGVVCRVVDFPPVGALDAAALERLKRESGLEQHRKPGEAPRHPFMHQTRSVDFGLILEGEIDMLLDESEVHLRAGDVVVQQATNHAWVNRGSRPCRIAFILVDGEEIRS